MTNCASDVSSPLFALRTRLALLRWTYVVVVLPAAALAIIFVFQAPLDYVAAKLASVSDLRPPYVCYLTYTLAVCALACMVVRFGGISPVFRRPNLWYPGTWLAALVGCLIYEWIRFGNARAFASLGAFPYVDCVLGLYLAAFLLMVVVVPVAISVVRRLMRDDPRPVGTQTTESKEGVNASQPQEEQGPAAENSVDLDFWLSGDDPIDHPERDYFGHAGIARRIARILRETPVRTIGLLGPYGCGKSSILNLVEYYQRHPDEVDKVYPTQAEVSHSGPHKRRIPAKDLIWCRVAEWGVTSESAASVILTRAIHETASHVDCLSCATLPAYYAAALGKAPWGQLLSSLLQHDESPEQLLRRLNNMLACIGKRLVICLEDLDRNITKDKSDRLGHVGGLLDRIKALDNITFVVAVGQSSEVDELIIKVLEHIEPVPKMAQAEVTVIYNAFRNRALANVPPSLASDSPIRDAIDPLPEHKSISWEEIVARLVQCPRKLKSVLMQTNTAWRVLEGEVDLYDLTVVRMLQLCAPGAFTFVLTNLSQLRTTSRWCESEAWDTVTKKEDRDWDGIGAQEAITYLFHMAPQGYLLTYRHAPIQGVKLAEPTDYWTRANTGELKTDDISDLLILDVIDGWQRGREDKRVGIWTLAEFIVQKRLHAEKVRQLGLVLAPDRLRELVRACLKAVDLKCKYGKEDLSVLADLYAQIKDTPYQDIDGVAEWFHETFCEVMLRSLRLALDFYECWILDRRAPLPRHQFAFEQQWRLFDDFIARFSADPESLGKALESSSHDVLLRFLVDSREKMGTNTNFAVDAWNGLGGLLLSSLRANPTALLPELCNLLIAEKQDDEETEESAASEQRYEFQINRAREIFQDRLRDLMHLLAETNAIAQIAPSCLKTSLYARNFAKNWLVSERGSAERAELIK